MGREEKGLHSWVPVDVGGWAWRLMRHLLLLDGGSEAALFTLLFVFPLSVYGRAGLLE